MQFNSSLFLFIFLPITLVLYFLCPSKYKKYLLLVVSLIFYAFGEPYFMIFLIMSIVYNFLFARIIEKHKKSTFSKFVLFSSLIFNVTYLILFKYNVFLVTNFNKFLSTFSSLSIEVSESYFPIGVSFFTFSAISYLIEIYRGKEKYSKNIVDFALYISFFPKIIAGPIARFNEISETINKKANIDDIYSGITRFIIGLSKKAIIADNISPIVNEIFLLNNSELTTSVAWIGIIAYTIQIYIDFSGYTDMAIGLSRMFGFRLKENFNYPYLAGNLTEFWRRWHMTLTSWFRDYVYIPLGGNRKGIRKTLSNIFIVFLLVGIWHGASWTFIVWGLYHAFFMILERAKLISFITQTRIIRNIYLLFIVSVSWVYFRSVSLENATQYIQALFGQTAASEAITQSQTSLLHLDSYFLLMLVLGILISFRFFPKLLEIIEQKTKIEFRNNNIFQIVLLLFLFGILIYSIMQIANGTYTPFLYVRF